jgi:CHASE2 domain-containing sensor protein
LQLAIFNSCDGLGLASELQQLHIGQMIVMREPIPDLAAQEFLKHFLSAYVGGKSFYLAVREARERLQGLESSFPCASWLPVLCQNPAQVPPSWEELLNAKDVSTDVPQPNPAKPWWHNWQSVLLLSVISTSLVMGVRSLGLLQSWELQAFDQLMRQRPNEGPDQRLLLVTITEEDVQSQPLKDRGLASLSDRSLAQLLAKLEQSQARVIGLDIYREVAVGANYRNLATRLQKGDRFIAICKYGKFGITPPPEVPGDRQGFNNVLLDPDDVLRRHLLAVESPSPCQTKYSFNFQLATRYLADEKIQLKSPVNDYLQLDKTVFKTLEKDTGGYHNIDPRGHQVLLNYRASRQIAPSVTLKEVLNPQFNPDLVKNRIVLIGTTAQSFNDHRWHTPYSGGRWSNPTMTGVEIQAHMVSQILSAVLDNRPLIWWWSKPGEAVWIWCWSLVGGLLTWRFESPLRLVLSIGVTLGVLYGCCLGLLTLKGGWVPLVPSALVLVVTGGSVVIYSLFQARQQP